MPTTLEDELGLGPVVHRLKNRASNLMGRIGMRHTTQDHRLLDPLTVSYEVWNEMRRHIRKWPRYREVPNSVEVLVSPEDWEDYWGIDTERKQASIAAYVAARAHDKGLWMAGDPQVRVVEDDAIEPGGIECDCQFMEPSDEGVTPATPVGAARPQAGGSPRTARIPVMPRIEERPQAHRHVRGQDDGAGEGKVADATPVAFEPADAVGKASLTDDGGFRLTLSSGDTIGAVADEGDVIEDVNVRLDKSAFRYLERRQCAIGVIDGRWKIVNYSSKGTKLVCATGMRLMLLESVPYPLEDGDTIYLGADRPLRFEIM